MKTAKLTTTAEVRPHPFSNEHWRGVITTARGLCYFCDWRDDGATPKTEESVLKTWKEDRKAFEPLYS